MDQFQATSSTVRPAPDPRAEFNSAYANLEQTIRNFSKEKLKYEQTIESLNHQVALGHESLQNLSVEMQDVLAENTRLLTLHEENEQHRSTFDTVCNAVERKQEIIEDSLQGFEKFERDVCSRYEEHEEFIYCLKFRQLQLKEWIDDTLKKNATLNQSFKQQQEECAILVKQFNDATLFIQQQNDELVELAETEKSMEAEIAALKKKLEQEIIKSGEEKDALLKQLNDQRAQTEQQAFIFGQERSSYENKIEQTNVEIQGLQEILKQKKELMDSLQVEFEKVKDQMAVEKSDLEAQMICLQQDLEQAKNNAESQRSKLEEQIANLAQERTSLEKKHDERSTKLTEENSILEIKVGEDTKLIEGLNNSLAQEKESLKKINQELDETKVKMDTELSLKESEKIALNENLEKLKATMEDLKMSFKDETNAMTMTFQDEYTKHQKEREELVKKHDETITNLKEELAREKNERRMFQKKYHDQKLAISKVVEEVGVRPVILPSGKDTRRVAKPPVFSTPPSSQDAQRNDVNRVPPKTPLNLRPPMDPMTPTRAGILKRHSFSAGDKSNRNVSFGPTLVADFVIPSDTDDSASEVQDQTAEKEVPAGKRLKLSDSSKPTYKDVEVGGGKQREEDKSGKPTRRYVRRIVQHKTAE